MKSRFLAPPRRLKLALTRSNRLGDPQTKKPKDWKPPVEKLLLLVWGKDSGRSVSVVTFGGENQKKKLNMGVMVDFSSENQTLGQKE